MNNFDGARGNNDGVVTWEEFCEYYQDLSISIPSDEYFVRMMESTWQVAEEDEGDVAQKTVKNLAGEVRSRVLQLSKNDPVLLKKIFNDFDLTGTESLTIDEVTNMIIKLRISVERKYIHPFFKMVDANNSGAIEQAEFESFIMS